MSTFKIVFGSCAEQVADAVVKVYKACMSEVKPDAE